jgi:hypothetical protein
MMAFWPKGDEMVQIDIPAAFIASQVFLDIGRNRIKKEAAESSEKLPAIYYKFLFRAVFFAGFVIAPAGIYLLAGWPGWEQIYWTERVEKVIFNWVNALLPALFVMAIVFSAYIGHVLGYRWLVTGKERLLRPTYIVLLAAVSVLVLANYPAFVYVGTFREYHFSRDIMVEAWKNPHDFSIGWIMVMVYVAFSFLYLLFRIKKEEKES